MEKKLRAKLEEELKELRQEKESGGNNRVDGDVDVEQLTRKLSACEEKVIIGSSKIKDHVTYQIHSNRAVNFLSPHRHF